MVVEMQLWGVRLGACGERRAAVALLLGPCPSFALCAWLGAVSFGVLGSTSSQLHSHCTPWPAALTLRALASAQSVLLGAANGPEPPLALLLQVADLVCVNKSDGPTEAAARRAVADYNNSLALLPKRCAPYGRREALWDGVLGGRE